MYFSEQGNVDYDATFITIFLVSFNLQSCCLMQSAVCSLQMSYTGNSRERMIAKYMLGHVAVSQTVLNK